MVTKIIRFKVYVVDGECSRLIHHAGENIFEVGKNQTFASAVGGCISDWCMHNDVVGEPVFRVEVLK